MISTKNNKLKQTNDILKNLMEKMESVYLDREENLLKDEIDVELLTSIKTLINFINTKNKDIYGHMERVVAYSEIMADKLELSESAKKTLIYGAYMHDIGKVNVSKEILMKKSKLTEKEWGILKQHPINGVEIIKYIGFHKEIIPLVVSHHERYDGKGYPNNLQGEEIPYLARIISVVDSFDAMTSDRQYNTRKTYEEGIQEIERCSETQFDPKVVKAFSEVIRSNVGISVLDSINKQ